jgi:redox-sensitive bicupin YhaK (pirin superfamily)
VTGHVTARALARGAVRLNETALSVGDGAAVSEEARLTVTARDQSEVLVFDLS